MALPSRSRSGTLTAALVAAVAAIVGAAAAVYYHRLGLTLSHYDARGHLVVARRIFDSITPGWQQIGAVWLPLPHLLNALPVQIDLLYRTGASAVVMSIASFAVTAGSISWIVWRLTGSPAAGAVGAGVFAFNPNVLYLQATPMSEPLLFALMTSAVALLIGWCSEDETGRPTAGAAGWALALACLTRYEAWPVTAAALLAASWARYRRGETPAEALGQTSRVAVYPVLAIILFVIFSRAVIGEWFVTSGFFVPDNPAEGHPLSAAGEVAWGARMLSGYGLVALALVGLGASAARGLFSRLQGHALIALSLVATSALPIFAFMKGHPFRIRYMVPLMVAQGVGVGLTTGMWKRARVPLTILALAVALVELRPLDLNAPMVAEAQWDRPHSAGRQTVTRCLQNGYDGETIMASMGSLGHYMQELSQAGFRIRDFLHEGNGDIWLSALDDPRPFAGWVLVEEEAEGGDMLAKREQEDPRFLAGFTRVCEGAGVALYQRNPGPKSPDYAGEIDPLRQSR